MSVTNGQLLIEQAPNTMYAEDIRDFHVKFGLTDGPEVYLERHAAFRQGFLLEEVHELSVAFNEGNLAKYLDALVDINYVALGSAFLMGRFDLFARQQSASIIINHLKKDPHRGHMLAAPQPPLPSQYVFFLGNMYTYLGVVFHEVMMARRGGDLDNHFERASFALMDVHRIVIDHSFLCGLNFVEAWNRVHCVNMLKVRAAKAADSKRGSTVDVVKPEGWEPAILDDLVGDTDGALPSFFKNDQQVGQSA